MLYEGTDIPKREFYEVLEEYFAECTDDLDSAPDTFPELLEDLAIWVQAHQTTATYFGELP
jgi:hypothetical protein